MQTTTLTTRDLADTTVEYKFIDGILTLRITTLAAHKLYGAVNINFANVDAYDITLPPNTFQPMENQVYTTIVDYFNTTDFSFSVISDVVLECEIAVSSGITESATFIELPDDGVAIVASVDNASIDLPAGSYNFLLLDTADSEFSTSTITATQLNLDGTGVNGVAAEYNEDGTGGLNSINNLDLTFSHAARIALKNNVAGTTNIPLVIQ